MYALECRQCGVFDIPYIYSQNQYLRGISKHCHVSCLCGVSLIQKYYYLWSQNILPKEWSLLYTNLERGINFYLLAISANGHTRRRQSCPQVITTEINSPHGICLLDLRLCKVVYLLEVTVWSYGGLIVFIGGGYGWFYGKRAVQKIRWFKCVATEYTDIVTLVNSPS